MFLKNLFLLFKTWEILCKIQIPSFSKKKKREKYWPVSHCLAVSPSPKGQQAFRTERWLPMSRGLSRKPVYHSPRHARLSLQRSGQGLPSLITALVQNTSCKVNIYQKRENRTSLVAQWLGICLPRQGTQGQSLVQEHFTRHGAAKPVRPNYRAHMLQLLKPAHLEPGLHNKRSHCSEKAEHRDEEKPPLATTRESPHRNKDPEQPEVN